MKIFSDAVRDWSSTIGERNEVDDSLALLLFSQTIMGQQIINPTWSWKGSIFRHTFLIGLIIYVIFGTMDVLENDPDFSTKGEAYYTFLITARFLGKYLLYLGNRKNFQKIYVLAKMTLFDIIKNSSPKQAADLINKLKLLVKLFLSTVTAPIIVYILKAIWCDINGELVTLSKTTSILMPMTTPYYEIGFVLHAIYLSNMAFSICVADAWFVIVMLFFCVTCDCLVIDLQVERKTEDVSDLEYATRLNDRLRMFYINHERLMTYLNILSDMYKWAAVVPLISVLLAFCLIMFLMSEQVEWAFMINFIPTSLEIFAYNWFGEQLKLKASEVKTALLDFDWPNMSIADKKSYLIILTHMQREFSIKTAFGNDLSLSTMTDVLKASYQAFTLMKTMKD